MSRFDAFPALSPQHVSCCLCCDALLTTWSTLRFASCIAGAQMRVLAAGEALPGAADP